MTYLYLLPFKDGVHFKLGISKMLDSRITSHNKTYELDLNKALIAYAKNSLFILSLEQELLSLLDAPIDLEKADGYTEIRLMQDFKKALDYINSKDDFLGFKIEKYIDAEKIVKKAEKANNRRALRYMRAIKKFRKDLGVTPEELMLDWLGLSKQEYIEIEEKGCEDEMKSRIVSCLIMKCGEKKLNKDFMLIEEKLYAILKKIYKC